MSVVRSYLLWCANQRPQAKVAISKGTDLHDAQVNESGPHMFATVKNVTKH